MLVYATYVTVGLSISALIVVVGIYASRATYNRKIRGWKSHGINSTLEKAIEGFDDAHKLGHGGYGEVFRIYDLIVPSVEGRPREEERLRLDEEAADNHRNSRHRLSIEDNPQRHDQSKQHSFYKPKIADFGLARFSSCGRNVSSATIAGTLYVFSGYLASEYLAQGRLTEKSMSITLELLCWR
ncbi:hypothetical protein TIFTF001_011751 [Ficus carica]|uniref:Uncharacterized protein n=1 Tax=Ficus carica TaxID=3494 RepID=A0AA88AMC7_FICCA|nr:hypothetical protein TIFTF001_011751 [Ficus carica]